jgi:hypothetical protein
MKYSENLVGLFKTSKEENKQGERYIQEPSNE